MVDDTPVVIRHHYPDARALADALAGVLCRAVSDALAERDRALLVLAGGRTPLPAYRAFAAQALPWSRVTLLPSDERCVPYDHPASNVRELREIFAPAADATVEALTTPDGDPEASTRAARAMLERHPQPFDLVVLGMGGDAHTASLFPGASQLLDALDSAGALAACRIDPHPLPPDAPFPRVTLTLPRLLDTRALHLVVTGEAKRAVLDAALAPGADPMLMPVAAILHAPGAHVHVHWSP